MDKLTVVVLLAIVVVYLVYSNLPTTGDIVSKNIETKTITEEATVSKVIDGDTIEINTGDTVRLLGINAQEKGQKCYLKAAERLKELVEGKIVVLEKGAEEKDKYGRLLRYVYVGDVFVNKEMLSEGLASIYLLGNSTIDKELKEAEFHKGCIWEKSDSCSNCIGIGYFKANAEGDDCKNLNGEYVTFVNSCSYPCDMSGWTVKDEGRNTYTFPSFFLGKESKATLYTGKGSNIITQLYWNREGKTCRAVWNNDKDTLYLRDKKGDIVLEYRYELNETENIGAEEEIVETTDPIINSNKEDEENQETQDNTTHEQDPGYLIISEIMYNPIQDENYNEWVEIYNPSDISVDIGEWTLCGKPLLAGYVRHNDSIIYSDNGLILEPNSFAVVTDGGSGTDAYENFQISGLSIHVDASSICGRLSNSGKEITLEKFIIMDTANYTNEYANGNGKTLERKGNSLFESLVENGTPGKENSVYRP